MVSRPSSLWCDKSVKASITLWSSSHDRTIWPEHLGINGEKVVALIIDKVDTLALIGQRSPGQQLLVNKRIITGVGHSGMRYRVGVYHTVTVYITGQSEK